jgi:uncharacterized protein YbaA (DUF1428 family)
MKKIFGSWRPEEPRGRNVPVQNITSFYRSVNYGKKKYVIF